MKIINICDNIENFVAMKDKFLSADVQNIVKEIEKDKIKVLFSIGDDLVTVRLNDTLSAIFLNENGLYWYLAGVWNGQILGINK